MYALQQPARKIRESQAQLEKPTSGMLSFEVLAFFHVAESPKPLCLRFLMEIFFGNAVHHVGDWSEDLHSFVRMVVLSRTHCW